MPKAKGGKAAVAVIPVWRSTDNSSAIRDSGELLKRLMECSEVLSASHTTADR